MPAKIKSYKWVKFPSEVLQNALYAYKNALAEDQVKADYRIQDASESWWRYDYGEETTFFNDYQTEFRQAVFKPVFDRGYLQVVAKWHASPPFSEVTVRLPEKSQIASVFKFFEDFVSSLGPPWKSQVKIFIGHGRSPQWKALRDYLVKKQQLKVETYEIGARAGFTTKEILEEMLVKSSFALLVMTGEDKDAEGKLHARENVIHEVGLFQGKLGFRRAIVLLEEETEEFSNIKGIDQIRFKKGLIKDIFGKVIEALEREFCS